MNPKRTLASIIALLVLVGTPLAAQTIVQTRGADSRVDYASLVRFGPWDDRNYLLTQEGLALLARNEAELNEPVPAFFRVALRRMVPDMLREGPVQYPRSALPYFFQEHGGYLVDGVLYGAAKREDGRWVVVLEGGIEVGEDLREFLEGEARVTNPNGAAESAIAISPADRNRVIAGTNGPGGGQRMHFSSDGGETWTQAPTLPGPGTCCDPTVGWSADGAKAYTATLGIPELFFYRSADNGETWTDLPGGAQVQVDDNSGFVDKEYFHVDTFATSPFKDNIYMTWHESNVMKFSRSTDRGETWSAEMTVSVGGQQGIGSDITTDKSGNVYYFWPSFIAPDILVRKSTDGGATFLPSVQISTTEDEFDFPIPSMETRNVFIYVSADADRTGGPFADSIYAAWTDNNGPEQANPADNHARIQVAYSRDGGATWTITTPHETADILTVDRWHQWLAVAPDGSVHVVFYDTRRDPSRTSVDLFHSVSTDGAQTWSTPERVTSQQSPNISGSFEFGDYNGMDIVMNDLIAIFTDNRDEAGGGAQSVDVYAAGRLLDADAIFSDGFESGDVSAWSGMVP